MSDNSPKMFNVIVTWDVYAVANEGQSAEAAVLELIKSGEISATHRKALPMKVSPVREAWRDERPIVGDDVSDADFARLRGKTTQQAYELLTKK